MECRVESCDREVKYKSESLCNRHYLRLRRHGSPTAGGAVYGQAHEWIEKSIPTDCDDCVYWPFGRFADGYGAIQVDGKKWRAHRYICQMVHGEPPDESMDAAHKCGKGHLGCVNDRHIYWATRSQNLADRVEHGTVNEGGRNGWARLAEADARAILDLKGSGLLQKEVAGRFGVSRELVGRIWRRVAWRCLDRI